MPARLMVLGPARPAAGNVPDLAPTVLARLGVALPPDLDGRPLLS